MVKNDRLNKQADELLAQTDRRAPYYKMSD